MKNMKSLYVFIVFVIFLAASSASLYAGEPTNQVKGSVDKVIDVLKDKELKNPSKAEQRRAAIRKTVGERFDFEEMSKRTLAVHWQERTAEERKEFISLFSDLLERSYINKIERYTDEKIIYGDESVEGDYGTVKTKIVTKRNEEIPIEYKLIKKGTQWEVYDVVIEGVSLVNNYRNQFSKIISSGSYEELIKRLKNKRVEGLADDKAS